MATAGTSKDALAMAATQMGFTCSISQEVMEDPVVAADGFSYERSSIVGWLAGHSTSPLTNEELAHKMLTPNRNLRSNIQTWLEVQAGGGRVAKRRKTSAEEIRTFLQGLPKLVRSESVAEIVQGLRLGSELPLHTAVLDALCRLCYGGKEACARVVAGGGLGAAVASMREDWAEACSDACSILQMVLRHSDDVTASVAAIDAVGGIQAVVRLAKTRSTATLLQALYVLRRLTESSLPPPAVQVADRVVADVTGPIVLAMAAHKRNLDLLASACATLEELARDGRDRQTAGNVAAIAAAGGVHMVVECVGGACFEARAAMPRARHVCAACSPAFCIIFAKKMRASFSRACWSMRCACACACGVRTIVWHTREGASCVS